MMNNPQLQLSVAGNKRKKTKIETSALRSTTRIVDEEAGKIESNVMCEAAQDRISALPNPILHHILSFLPTKIVASTSTVSKRWNRVWTCVPVLDFEEAVCGLSTTRKVKEFTASVEKYLRDRAKGSSDHEANIQKFIFCCREYMGTRLVKSSISSIVKCEVEEMILHLFPKTLSVIPPSLFACKSLISLELIDATVTHKIRFPEYISLPKLKTLTLRDITFSIKSEQLFAGCHVLEELSLIECTFPLREFCISCPMLKSLIINNSEGVEALIGGCVLRINAPNLLSLYYLSNFAGDYILPTFVALVKADFHFFGTGNETREQKIAASKFLGAVSHVKHLSIFASPVQKLLVSEDLLKNMPIFHKLNLLELVHVTGDKTVIDLLRVSPNLESLVFSLFLDGDNYSDDDIEGSHTSFQQLKEVSFKSHYGHPRELIWMKLILKNAVSLQNMAISFFSVGLERREELMEEIRNVPRASSVCMLKFS